MTITGLSFLDNPPQGRHIVFPYTEAERVIDAVSLFAEGGLRRDDAIVLLITDQRCVEVRKLLRLDGFNVDKLEGSDQLICVDAAQILAKLMRNGTVDDQRFKEIVVGLIQRAEASSGNGHPRPVRVFGEMVSLLWQENVAETQHLEDLWNAVMKEHDISLLCTYDLAGKQPSDLPENLATCHSHYIC